MSGNSRKVLVTTTPLLAVVAENDGLPGEGGVGLEVHALDRADDLAVLSRTTSHNSESSMSSASAAARRRAAFSGSSPSSTSSAAALAGFVAARLKRQAQRREASSVSRLMNSSGRFRGLPNSNSAS